ncbi:MAG: c-type cytochrome domain-containing protein [Planctomycetota bacterium]
MQTTGFGPLGFALITLAAAIGFASESAPPEDGASPAAIDFAQSIEPVFAAACYKCHGEKRGLGGLKMHTAGLLAGLEDEGLLVPGDPESSELYNRLVLPDGDKLRMPKGSGPLPKEQIAAIRLWIEQGAEVTLVAAASPAPNGSADPAKADNSADAGSDGRKPAAVSAEVLARLEATGASIVPLYAGSTLLSVGFPSGPSAVDDAMVDQLTAVAENVAWLDLGGTQVTDAGARKLAGFSNLARLHLERTAVTDASARSLSGLVRLEYLNLYGTAVTDATLAELASLPKLRRLYVWQTAISYEAAKKLASEKDGLEVNLGWDHPGVVRDRLSRELARVEKAKAEAKKSAAMAERELNAAKERLKASNTRVAEIKAELKALDQSPEARRAKAGPVNATPAQDKPTDQPKPATDAEKKAKAKADKA